MESYKQFCKRKEKELGSCFKCGKKMEHLREIHTFQCSCGYREWYCERVGDKELDIPPTYCAGCSFRCQATGCECVCHDKMREYWKKKKESEKKNE